MNIFSSRGIRIFLCVCVRQRQFLRPVGRPVSAGSGSCGYEAAVRGVANIAATTCELIDSARPSWRAKRRCSGVAVRCSCPVPPALGMFLVGQAGQSMLHGVFSGDSCHPGFTPGGPREDSAVDSFLLFVFLVEKIPGTGGPCSTQVYAASAYPTSERCM
jgi:hypothetical protein